MGFQTHHHLVHGTVIRPNLRVWKRSVILVPTTERQSEHIIISESGPLQHVRLRCEAYYLSI